MLRVNANFTFMKGSEEYDWFKNKYTIGYGPDDIRQLGDSKAYKSTTNDFTACWICMRPSTKASASTT